MTIERIIIIKYNKKKPKSKKRINQNAVNEMINNEDCKEAQWHTRYSG